MSQVRFGVDVGCENGFQLLRDHRRIGLLMNQASISASGELTCDVIHRHLPDQLVALFSPQHGLWGEQQANMIESPDALYAPLNLPVHSLYSQTRRPTDEMLSQIDCLVIDLQDVGTRVYTFIWTMLECLQACAEFGKAVIILDRPNPLGGEICEGPLLDTGFCSFVGGAAIPLRHGLTMAELARLFVHELSIDVQLEWIACHEWNRNDWFGTLNRRWIWPSPNVPTLDSILFYPGQVLLEGTNLSEGRGTARPFELVAAPYLDAHALIAEARQLHFPGVHLRPTHFVPTFDKWQGQSCSGVELQCVDPSALRSVALTLTLIGMAANLGGEHFRWLEPPYEYEFDKMPIDILFGNDQLRNAVATGLAPEKLAGLAALEEDAWLHRCENLKLYT